MVFNETAAAYGLFQVVFAEMHEYLAAATYHLRQRDEQSLQYEEVHDRPFKQTLKEFRKRLCQLSDSDILFTEVEALRKACDSMGCLAHWRNDHVHARVRRTEEGLELYAPLRNNPGQGQRLEMSREFIEGKIREAMQVTATFQAAGLGAVVFNEATAAYGLFQVVFAEMHECLAATTYHLRRRDEQSLQYEKVHTQRFQKTLKEFRRLAKRLGRAETVKKLRKSCASMVCLARWRNERVHARVIRTDGGLELYARLLDNPDKSRRLEMSKDVFEARIREAIKTRIDFQMYAAELNADIRSIEVWDRHVATLPTDPD